MNDAESRFLFFPAFCMCAEKQNEPELWDKFFDIFPRIDADPHSLDLMLNAMLEHSFVPSGEVLSSIYRTLKGKTNLYNPHEEWLKVCLLVLTQDKERRITDCMSLKGPIEEEKLTPAVEFVRKFLMETSKVTLEDMEKLFADMAKWKYECLMLNTGSLSHASINLNMLGDLLLKKYEQMFADDAGMSEQQERFKKILKNGGIWNEGISVEGMHTFISRMHQSGITGFDEIQKEKRRELYLTLLYRKLLYKN